MTTITMTNIILYVNPMVDKSSSNLKCSGMRCDFVKIIDKAEYMCYNKSNRAVTDSKTNEVR